MLHDSKAFKIQGHQEVVFDAELWKSIWAQLMRALQRCFAFRDKGHEMAGGTVLCTIQRVRVDLRNALLTP